MGAHGYEGPSIQMKHTPDCVSHWLRKSRLQEYKVLLHAEMTFFFIFENNTQKVPPPFPPG